MYDFSPEQLRNLSAIVWLYRGQRDRFLGQVKDCLIVRRVCIESDAIPSVLAAYDDALADLRARFSRFADTVARYCEIDVEKQEPVAGAVRALSEAASLYKTDREQLLTALHAFGKTYADALPFDNEMRHAARAAFAPIAEAIRGLMKQVDLLYKLAARITDLGGEMWAFGPVSSTYDRRGAVKLLKELDERCRATV
jgi:type I restriction enzyme M protein